MSRVLLAFAVLASSAVAGDSSFAPTELLAEGGFYDVDAADFDGDGDLDLVVAINNAGIFAWIENTDGLGTFGNATVISSGRHNPTSVACADFDGDGDVDVLTASYVDGVLSWFENLDGAATFGDARVLATGESGLTVACTADLDGDGDIDVAASAIETNTIFWQENLDGLGTFGEVQPITFSSQVVGLSTADFDRDGDADLLMVDNSKDLVIWSENLGGGTFAPQKTLAQTRDTRLQDASAADIDDDGALDIVWASEYSVDLFPLGGELVWQRGFGDGTFGPRNVIVQAPLFSGFSFVTTVDIDGDREPDVIATDPTNVNGLSLYENLGDGHFAGPVPFTGMCIDSVQAVEVVDLDGDGDLDVVSASTKCLASIENVAP